MEKIYPQHVAIILDGNRRWAKEKGLPQLKGHQKGFENIRQLAPYIINKGVKVLSVFAFSTENFKRAEEEVKYLMDLFVDMFKKECNKIHEENIKIIFSGRRDNLRKDVLEAMDYITEKTKNNTKGIFNICLNYGGQQEIADGAKKIALDVQSGKLDPEDINENLLYKYMYNELPPIDYLIRTSGEERISNFMLYELSYAEMYFPKIYFPDFDAKQFEKAIDIYNGRERRFGGNKK
ncbi:MAG TPA: di-trans,poly-cis-decaprenylcistransferase [Candidatus Coprovivens excrementavium]|nr:di-trans,poly-cis-decaprenylcistransferase [Candidatus Coprovivens excrementavium]